MDRALDCHSRGQEFEPPHHRFVKKTQSTFLTEMAGLDDNPRYETLISDNLTKGIRVDIFGNGQLENSSNEVRRKRTRFHIM